LPPKSIDPPEIAAHGLATRDDDRKPPNAALAVPGMRRRSSLALAVCIVAAFAAGRCRPAAAQKAAAVCSPSALPQRTAAVNAECCNDKDEDCSSGVPATCDAGCAGVFLPFWRDCAGALGADGSALLSGVVAECQRAAGGGGGGEGGGATHPQCAQPYETLDDAWRLTTAPIGQHCDRGPVHTHTHTHTLRPPQHRALSALTFLVASGRVGLP
jgi:hypothetical protein